MCQLSDILLYILTFPTTIPFFSFFFFNDTATTEIYTLSLHDALPISSSTTAAGIGRVMTGLPPRTSTRSTSRSTSGDRKSTRLNSSHLVISYAVFCLKKKKIDIARHVTKTSEIGQHHQALSMSIRQV